MAKLKRFNGTSWEEIPIDADVPFDIEHNITIHDATDPNSGLILFGDELTGIGEIGDSDSLYLFSNDTPYVVIGHEGYYDGGSGNFYQLAHEGNLKTVNGNSLFGTGNLSITATVPWTSTKSNILSGETGVRSLGSASDKWSSGHFKTIKLYGNTGAGYTGGITLSTSSTTNYTITLPSKDGTMALTSDIPNVGTVTSLGTLASISTSSSSPSTLSISTATLAGYKYIMFEPHIGTSATAGQVVSPVILPMANFIASYTSSSSCLKILNQSGNTTANLFIWKTTSGTNTVINVYSGSSSSSYGQRGLRIFGLMS